MKLLTNGNVITEAGSGASMSMKPYLGRLTPTEAAEGMAAARRSAIRLAKDAMTLLEAGRWPTAASLAMFSIEESGKIGLLRRLTVEATPNALNKGWNGYREHFTKSNVPVGIDPWGVFTVDPAAFQKPVEAGTKLVNNLNLLKHAGVNSDCILDGDKHPSWIEPADRITENLARTAVVCAGLLIRKAPVSVREVELFVHHVGPVVDNGDLLSGWRCWTKAMDAEGLLEAQLEEAQSRVLDGFFGQGWRYHPF